MEGTHIHTYTFTYTRMCTIIYNIYSFRISTPTKPDIGHNKCVCVCACVRSIRVHGHNHGHGNHRGPADKHKTDRHTTLLWFIFSSRWVRARVRSSSLCADDGRGKPDGCGAEEGNTDASPWGKNTHLYYIHVSNPVPDTDLCPLIIFCRHWQKSHRVAEYTKTIENVIVPLEKPSSAHVHTHVHSYIILRYVIALLISR